MKLRQSTEWKLFDLGNADGMRERRWSLDLPTCPGSCHLDKLAQGGICFYVCQFLTSNGYVMKYVHRMGKVGSHQCAYCGEED